MRDLHGTLHVALNVHESFYFLSIHFQWHIEEMIDGLLKCRGPASKTDIIAIRQEHSEQLIPMTFLLHVVCTGFEQKSTGPKNLGTK